MHQIFKTLCVEFKLCSIEYFMYELEEWECCELYSNLQFSDRNMLESTRLITYFASLPYMKEKIEISEFMKLPWDEGYSGERNTEISDAQIKKIKQRANNISKKLGKTN